MADCFWPGLEYGNRYRHLIWVCVNPTARSFEKCDPEESARVWQLMQQTVQRLGLGRSTLVSNSGCLLGCKASGTTIVIASQDALNDKGERLLFFRKVKIEDVETLLRTHLLGR